MDLLKLEEEMKKAGYTVERLAELSGIPVETIAKLFSGEIPSPSYELMNKIENVLRPKQNVDSIKETNAEYAAGKDEYTLEDYYALPDDLRVELIDGSFYVMEAPAVDHQAVLVELLVTIRNFIDRKKGRCRVFCAPIDVQLDCDDKTMVQPDLLILCDEEKRRKKCIYGAPDFIAEILSGSTRTKDMNLKLRKYRRAGVREYWMIDIEKEQVITYVFEQDEIPKIYGSGNPVPVWIFNEELKMDFRRIFRKAL